MARIVEALLVVTLVCAATPLSFGGDAWGPASLDDPSAGVIGINIANLVNLPADAPKFDSLPQGSKGVVFGEVVEGGFIQAAGGRQFDMILALNGWQVESSLELYVASRTLVPGKPATAVILRSSLTDGVVEYQKKPIQITAIVPTRRSAILSRLVEEGDPVSGEKRIRHIRAIRDRTVESQVSPTFQIKNGKPTDLRVLFSVVGPVLTVPNRITILAGDRTSAFPVKIADVGTNIASATASAWVEWPVTPKLITSLSDIAAQGQGTLRFEPREGGAVSVVLGRETVMRISDVLVGYKLQGGNIADTQLEWYCEQVQVGDANLAKATSGITLRKSTEVFSPPAVLSPRTAQRNGAGQQ